MTKTTNRDKQIHGPDAMKNHGKYFDMLPDAILVTDAAGNILYTNGLTEKLFSYDKDELIGQPVEILVPDALRANHERQRGNFMAHPGVRPMGTQLHLQARRKDGTVFPVDISLAPLPINDDVLVISVIRDLTERQQVYDRLRQSTQRLQESQERFKTLLDNSLDAVMIVDAQGNIIYHSPASRNILGFSDEAMMGRNAFDFVHPEIIGEFKGHLADLLAHPRKTSRYEALIRHKNGSWKWVETIVTNLLDVPSIGGIVVNYRDITERKHSEEAVRQNIQRAEILVRISERINSKIDLDELLQTICAETASALNARAVGIYLLDSQTNNIRLRASYGLSVSEKDVPLNVPLEAFEGLMKSNGSTGIIEDPLDVLPAGSEALWFFTESSVIYAAVRGEGPLIGVLAALI
ncbi:MAG: PAS domain S-box protein, partial [Chloroflexota bacterium]